MTHTRWARDRQRGRFVVGALAALIVLGACSGDSDQGTESSAADNSVAGRSVPEAEESHEASAPGDAAGGGDGENSSLGSEGTVPIVQDRELVRTGFMRVEIESDIDGAVTDVRGIADDADGFVASEDVRTSSYEASMTVRVPAEAFDAVREELAGLGDVTSESTETDDVTEELVDIETRMESMRASIERLRDLFESAGSIDDLTRVEQELATREADLESLLGRQRDLQDQVALSTLTVELSIPPEVIPEDPDVEDDDGLPSFLDGLGLGWRMIVAAGHIALAATGFLLPFLVPAVALAIILRRLFLRRRTPEAPPPPVPPTRAA